MSIYKKYISIISLFLLAMILVYCFIHRHDAYFEQDVMIQNHHEQDLDSQPDSHYCTDDEGDCAFNQDFFLDTWITGKVASRPERRDADGRPLLDVKK